MCERGKTTLDESELFGALLISERVCQKCCALSCFSIDEKILTTFPYFFSPLEYEKM